MTNEKNTPLESPASPPPTITPQKAVPRPPGPPPAGEQISTEHFALPEVDLNSLAKLPDFAGITSSGVDEAPPQGAVRHGGGRTTPDVEVDHGDEVGTSPDVAGSESDGADEGPSLGAKVKGWAGSTLDSVKSFMAKPEEDDDGEEHNGDADSDLTEGTGTPAAASSSHAGRPGAEGATSWPAEAEGTASFAPATGAPLAGTARESAGGPRKVRLAIARLDPWSVMKLAFLMSVALGIMLVVATWVFWYALNDLGVFTSIDELISGIVGQESADFDFLQYLARDKVMSAATLIAVVDVVLLTALATIGAFLYNIVAALVGGIHMTMSDD